MKKLMLILGAAMLCIAPVNAQKAKKQKKAAEPQTSVAKPEPFTLTPVDGKTLSYCVGVAQSKDFVSFLQRSQNIDPIQVPVVVEGMLSVQDLDSVAYEKACLQAIGIHISAQNRQECEMLNNTYAGKKDTLYTSQRELERGLYEALVTNSATITPDSARAVIDRQYQYQQEKRRYEGRLFLYENSLKPGVQVLPSGLQYVVRTKGEGPVATDTTEVEVHYEGRLLDGTVFDSSYKRGKPATFKPTQVIKGWTEALKLMPEGSIWEIYIPSELAYGERGQGRTIPGNSTLVFTVEIIKVKQ